MSPQRYDDWRNAVLRKIEELSALVERTDLDDLVKDELGSRDFKDALCAGRLSDYLRLARDALSKPISNFDGRANIVHLYRLQSRTTDMPVASISRCVCSIICLKSHSRLSKRNV